MEIFRIESILDEAYEELFRQNDKPGTYDEQDKGGDDDNGLLHFFVKNESVRLALSNSGFSKVFFIESLRRESIIGASSIA